jgi:hypothetical protein
MPTNKRNGDEPQNGDSPAKRLRSNGTNGINGANGHANGHGVQKKKILLNAFDMSTVGHLSPGQWKVSSSLSSVPAHNEGQLQLSR